MAAKRVFLNVVILDEPEAEARRSQPTSNPKRRRGACCLVGLMLALGGPTGCGKRYPSATELPAEVPSDGDPEIAAILEPILRQHRLPALAGAVVTSDGLEAVAAVGFRKWGESVPVTTNDLWHLGSNSKAMTAALVARMVEQGKMRWDTRVEEVFPDFVSTFHAEARGVTIEQLLMHRAGVVPDLDWWQYLRSGKTDVREQRLDAARQALAKRPRHAPGSHYEYANLGYVVCGAMLEALAGLAWEELIHVELFAPLGMTEVGQGGLGTVGQLDQPWGHTASGEPADGSGPDQDNPPVLGPAGRVHASLGSWALFIADQLRGARGEPALLKPETYQRLHRRPEGGEYALGWLVVPRDWGGGWVLTHAGSNTMHFAVVWIAPQKDFAVLVCSNQGDEEAAKAADEAAGALIEWHTAAGR